jgi:hypothetical protein
LLGSRNDNLWNELILLSVRVYIHENLQNSNNKKATDIPSFFQFATLVNNVPDVQRCIYRSSMYIRWVVRNIVAITVLLCYSRARSALSQARWKIWANRHTST